MYGMHRQRFSNDVLSVLRSVRTRTWVMLGGFVIGILALGIWAIIAVVSWLWAQVPAVVETGKHLTGQTITQVEQAVPGIKEEIGQWVPVLAALPTSDVAGSDVGPVPRYPGFVRSHFARGDETLEVGYAGRAPLDLVRTHYVQGFATVGYVGEVMTATVDLEHHRFSRAQESIDLLLRTRGRELVEVSITISANKR